MTEKRIAFLASDVTLPGSESRRSDGFEHDIMIKALEQPFADRDLALHQVSWSDRSVDWSNYDAALISTTWDYWDRKEEFLNTLEQIGTSTILFNSASIVRWNIDKKYLRELEAKGAKLINTIWMDVVDDQSVKSAFEKLGNDLVFKRQVGAGADGQYRIGPDDPIPQMPHPMMVQPFVKAIQTEGEFSFIFIDGAFSHCLIKKAKEGDYRIQSCYGGIEEKNQPTDDELEAAKHILSLLDEMPLYARVDMVRGSDDSSLVLMELEMIEPYLYPEQGPLLGKLMADAILKRVN